MIKYIKMSNGELVIGNVVSQSQYNIMSENTMVVIFDRTNINDGFYMGEYMPMTKSPVIPLFYKDIICMTDPDDSLLFHYLELFGEKVNDMPKQQQTNVKYH